MKIPRRRFVRSAFLTSGAAWLPWGDRLLCGSPLGLAVGVQLWSVREQLKENLDGTLHQLTAIGFREVELFETPKSQVLSDKNSRNYVLYQGTPSGVP